MIEDTLWEATYNIDGLLLKGKQYISRESGFKGFPSIQSEDGNISYMNPEIYGLKRVNIPTIDDLLKLVI